MANRFDPGYVTPPFDSLCENYPDELVYPARDFRVEWGPIFHRGRLDGTARILVLGQDPAAQETVARRILVGTAGHRAQGFLAKLGIDRSYVMINTFLYSVYGQWGGQRHKDDAAIAAYRHRWLDALLVGTEVRAVVALGGLADHAWTLWKATPAGAGVSVAYAPITHPTYPESGSNGNSAKRAELTKELLAGWNVGLEALKGALPEPDAGRPLVLYGETFAPSDLVDIPAEDLPAGLPPWMRQSEGWAVRTGSTAPAKRRTLKVTVPVEFVPTEVVP